RPGPVAEARATGAHGPRIPGHPPHHAHHGGGGGGQRRRPALAVRAARGGGVPGGFGRAREAHGRIEEEGGREGRGVEVMGQKAHPTGFRLGFNKTWRSRWYAEKDYANLLHEDVVLKKDLKKRFAHAGVSRVEIERAANKLKISIYTSRPGIIIGRKGQEVDKLKQEIQKRTGKEVFINIQEILKPELDAQLVSESVAL